MNRRNLTTGFLLLATIAALTTIVNLQLLPQKPPNRQSGFSSRIFTDSDRKQHKYVVFIPHALQPSEKVPVILFLNGLGENGYDGVKQISNNFGRQIWEIRRRFPMIAVAPQCHESWHPSSSDPGLAIAILDQVIKEYNVDEDRVYLTGVSSGAGGAWDLVKSHPDKFAAVVALSGIFSMDGAVSVKANLPIWLMYNDEDDASLVHNNRRFRQQLVNAGFCPVVTEYHRRGHDCWSAGYRHAGMFEWLSRQSLSNVVFRNHAAQPRRIFAKQSDLDSWDLTGAGTWTCREGIVTFHSAPNQELRSTVTLREELTDFEFHFDYRSSAGAPLTLTYESTERPSRPIEIAIKWPEHGTCSVVDTVTGECLAKATPIGERMLHAGQWNDVRLCAHLDKLSFEVNGTLLWEIVDQRFLGKHRIGFGIPSNETLHREWRYLRLWRINRDSA